MRELETAALVCAECGRADEDAERGWKAYIADLDEVAVYCPECAELEFGGDDA